MDRLTAVRTFAVPSYTPAKRVKVFDSRWYLVTFQNVETDPRCDYVGLGEGEYQILLPGLKTRQGRDAQLNHCNRIEQWDGEVWEVFASHYGSEELHSDGFYTSESNALRKVLEGKIAHEKWIADCEKQLAQYQARFAIKPEDWLAGGIRDCERVIREKRDAFKFELKQVR